MKERPILFKPPMVRAILEDRKTQTRRPVKQQPANHHWSMFPSYTLSPLNLGNGHFRFRHSISERNGEVKNSEWDGPVFKCPYGKPGDYLWVRECWWIATMYSYGTFPSGDEIKAPPPSQRKGDPVWFDADGDPPNTPNSTYPQGLRNGAFAAQNPYALWVKKPSIHMPRWASRIDLLIKDIRVEKLQSISEEDALAEGPPMEDKDGLPYGGGRYAFMALWDRINFNLGKGWGTNPWVWVVEFERVTN